MLTVHDKLLLLKQSSLFRDTPDELLAPLASSVIEQFVPAGETVIHKGEFGDTMFIISHGKMKVHDDQKIIAELGPNEIFGELAALSPEMRIASVTALENSLLLVISSSIMYEMIAKQKDLAKGIIKIICNRARNISKLQEQLIQQEKFASLGLISSGISHEIKNPLNFVINFSQLSQESLVELKSQIKNNNYSAANIKLQDLEGHIDKIIHHSKRADNVVNRLIQHAYQSGFKAENVVILGLLHQAISIVYQDFQKNNPDFIVQISLSREPEELTPIKVFPADLLKVFINIIHNSFGALLERKRKNQPLYEPKLDVAITEHAKTVEVTIKDNGGGIKNDEMTHLFQPFFTTKPAGSGSGLGLFIAHAIVTQQHNGQIKIFSDHKDTTTVSIILKKEQLAEGIPTP